MRHCRITLRFARTGIVGAFALCAALAACGTSVVENDAQLVESVQRSGSLEQQLSARVVTLQTGPRLLEISSRIVNRGLALEPVALRTCHFLYSDVQSSAQLVYHAPFVYCASVELLATLASGETSQTMQGTYEVRSGPGTYNVSVLHALRPEFRATVRITVH